MAPHETRVGLFRVGATPGEAEIIRKTIRLSHALIGLGLSLFSVGSGVAVALITAGEVRIQSVAENEVREQTRGYANRLIILESAVSNSVTRSEMLTQEEREREWRAEILKSIADLRIEIRSWHNFNEKK